MREQIKNSNNRAYSLWTNFIEYISWGASFGYRKKLPMTKSLRDPSVYEMKVVREQIKNSNNRAYSSGTNFIAEISRGASFGYRKNCQCQNRSGTPPYRG